MSFDDYSKYTSSPLFGVPVSSSRSVSPSSGTSRAVLNALQTLQDRINQLQSERSEYEQEISNLRSKVEQSRMLQQTSPSTDPLLKENADLRRQIQSLQQQIDQLQSQSSLTSRSPVLGAYTDESLNEENVYLKQKLNEERSFSKSKLTEFEHEVSTLKKKAIEMERAKIAAEESNSRSQALIEQLQQSLESLVQVNQSLVDRLGKTKTRAVSRPRRRPTTPKKSKTVDVILPYVSTASASTTHSVRALAQESRAKKDIGGGKKGRWTPELNELQNKLSGLQTELKKRIDCNCSVDDVTVSIQKISQEIKAKQRARSRGKKNTQKLRGLLHVYRDQLS
ncbi:hypothetical protein P9112_008905 [Eukaryota sp. TZLM1-RC]